MSELAFWIFLCLNLFGVIFMFITASIRARKYKNINALIDRKEIKYWRMMEVKFNIQLLLIWLLITPIVIYLLSKINLFFIPDSMNVIKIISPTWREWGVPGICIGMIISSIFLYRLNVKLMTENERREFEFYQKYQNKFEEGRALRDLSFFLMISSLFLIVVWMNTYIIIGNGYVQFKTGFPMSQRKYHFNEIKAIFRKTRTSGLKKKLSHYIIFSDGYVLDFDSEFFIASERERERFLKFLSKKSHVSMEQTNDNVCSE